VLITDCNSETRWPFVAVLSDGSGYIPVDCSSPGRFLLLGESLAGWVLGGSYRRRLLDGVAGCGLRNCGLTTAKGLNQG